MHSGLHTFLGDDPEFADAARSSGVRLVDYRRPPERMETAIGRLQFALGGGANHQLQAKRSYLYLLPLESIGPDARYWSQSHGRPMLG